MAIQLSDNINLIAPKILDGRYGPWISVEEANIKIRGLQRSRGLTVGILSGSSVVEYWYYSGITDSDLVLKTSNVSGNVVRSVDLEMPSAFTVTGNPITSSGKIVVRANGTVSQYIRGDGTLANFPDTTGGGGVNTKYYLNGSVDQGLFGGVTYNELNKIPVLSPAADFTRLSSQGDGYIAYFITDPNDPDRIKIPAGSWLIETFFNASTNSGSPQFYCELYKVSSTNVFTLISSNSSNPKPITNGTTIDLYFTTLAIPETVLDETDRLAIRVYVITDGNDITLHTQGDHLSEVTTTFTAGIESINGLSAQIQNFDEGESGNDFNISSTGNTHTFNLPIASSTKTGKISFTDWNTFNNKQNLLVSNVNIKTINGQTILGPGNIVISGTGVSSVTGTSPISSSGGITPVISISNAAANGTTKGAATFVASDFNDNGAGLISIDYTNGQSASSTTKGFLTSADWNTFNNKQNLLVSGVNIKTINDQTILGPGNIVITGTSSNGILSISGLTPINIIGTNSNPIVTVSNAAANGTNRGVATFTASDFNDNGSGLISIDYVNGQSASSSNKGFLTSSDWTTFNNKQNQISLTTTGNTGPSTFNPTTGVLNVPQYGGDEGSGLGYPLYFGCSPSSIGLDLTTYVFGPSFWGSALRITDNRSSRYLRALKPGRITAANIVVQWSGPITGTNLRSNISVVKKSGLTAPETSVLILSGMPMSTNDTSYDGDSDLRARNTFHVIETPFFVQQEDLVQIRFTTPDWPTGATVPLFSMTVVVFVE